MAFFWGGESCSFPPKEFQDLQKKISAAPLDVRGPLAEAFLLPYQASPTEIAQAIPGLQKRAKELAEHHMVILGSFGMYDIFCWGSILGCEILGPKVVIISATTWESMSCNRIPLRSEVELKSSVRGNS